MRRKIQSWIEKQIIKNLKAISHTVIIVLYKGEAFPEYCVPMPRDPKPLEKITLTNDFMKILSSIIKNNPAIKDGAIMIRIDHNPPVITGFSFRLYPPPLAIERKENKGSGYNSAIDFSNVDRVICVYFINSTDIKKFIKGKEVKIC